MYENTNFDESERDSGVKDIHEALGQSNAFLDFQDRLSRAAHVNRPVLLVGERGTGKELAATRIHYLSQRWQGPFVALNCSALSPTLIESELFGHESGSFTGASTRRTGRFEAAHGGTLFLDEIGNIPMQVQEKILRVVEYGAFERVGSSRSTEVDARIVGATNADLQVLVERGEFMPDLLDRLSFDVLVLPPLRDRIDDIDLLANHFAARMAYELNWENVPEITDRAMEKLHKFEWPGNVRELKNVIERAVYRSSDHLIKEDELIFDPFLEYSGMNLSVKKNVPSKRDEEESPSEGVVEKVVVEHEDDPDKSLTELVQELELRKLRDALNETQFNQRKAAEKLGITYHQFRGLYRKYQDELSS